MAQSISAFKGGFNGGTRANRFLVTIPIPTIAAPDLTFLCVAATLPSSELGSIKVPHRGRIAYFAGDRDYKPWTVTILDDTGDNHHWLSFHKWANALSNHTDNTAKDPTYSAATTGYLKNLEFKQLHANASSGSGGDHGFAELKKITLYQAWPSEIGDINLDMAEGGSLISYNVTFIYNYLEINTHAGT